MRKQNRTSSIVIILACVALAPASLAATWQLGLKSNGEDCRRDPDRCGSKGRVFWIAPTGRDKNSGRSRTSPWKSFDRAIPALRPGDTLMLEDGEYSSQNTGYPDVDCRSRAANGTSTANITIRAEHERHAFIRGDGSAYPFRMQNCKYWTIEGLHIENGDFSNTRGEARYGDTMYLTASQFLIIRRNLLARNNRYSNSHLIDSYYINHSLYVENEFYSFHRHGILDMYGGFNTYRRNYFNSRGYADLPDGRASGAAERGDSALCLYPAHDSIVENNISEGQEVGYDIQCAFHSNSCDNNKFLGNISLNDIYGHVFKARATGDAFMPHNTYGANEVVINPTKVGMYVRATKNTVCDHCSFFGGGKGEIGFAADNGGKGETGDGNYSVFVRNSIAVNFRGLPGLGFIVQDASGTWNWGWQDMVAFGNRVDYVPAVPNPHAVNVSKDDPETGACWLRDPARPSVRRKKRPDVGANLVYRYRDGQLTDEPLWDPKTGGFPHGEIIPEVNGIPGQSAMDVQQRLKIGVKGCELPLP